MCQIHKHTKSANIIQYYEEVKVKRMWPPNRRKYRRTHTRQCARVPASHTPNTNKNHYKQSLTTSTGQIANHWLPERYPRRQQKLVLTHCHTETTKRPIFLFYWNYLLFHHACILYAELGPQFCAHLRKKMQQNRSSSCCTVYFYFREADGVLLGPSLMSMQKSEEAW
jgi:hypothetical protein